MAAILRMASVEACSVAGRAARPRGAPVPPASVRPGARPGLRPAGVASVRPSTALRAVAVREGQQSDALDAGTAQLIAQITQRIDAQVAATVTANNQAAAAVDATTTSELRDKVVAGINRLQSGLLERETEVGVRSARRGGRPHASTMLERCRHAAAACTPPDPRTCPPTHTLAARQITPHATAACRCACCCWLPCVASTCCSWAPPGPPSPSCPAA
jgi:hypothetical protein